MHSKPVRIAHVCTRFLPLGGEIVRACSATKFALIKCELNRSCAFQCQRMSGNTSIEREQCNDASSRLQHPSGGPQTTFRSRHSAPFLLHEPSYPPILFGWLICKIVIGGVGAKLGYALRKFGSERALKVVVIVRDARADRCSPMIAALPGFRKGRSKITCCQFAIITSMMDRA